MRRILLVVLALSLVVLIGLPAPLSARPPIRKAFFAYYPNAVGTQLDNLPSNPGHCGVCHFDFNGGGPRNAYGLRVEVGVNAGLSFADAIAAIDGEDSDGDGYSNHTEITSTLFLNTPTFPGLSASNVSSIVNIPPAEVTPYLTPMGSNDTTPPAVAVTYPNGGEDISPDGFVSVTYSASDASGVAEVSIYLSDDGGSTFQPVGLHQLPSGTFSWYVPNLPGNQNLIRVVAMDGAGNPGQDQSDEDFTILPFSGGLAPTTMRDVHMDGTQPLTGVVLDDPETVCFSCHAGYNTAVEPGYNWRGGMMSQAMRDPVFLACMAVAEQDAPSVGDVCLRCHTPGGWMEGHSVNTGGGLVTAKDRKGITCDFCHRLVDRNYVAGVSPLQDVDVLAGVDPLPLQYGNGQYVVDPNPLRRGPYADAQASHQFVESPFHRSANLCGTCHDVSNPVYVQDAPGDYVLNGFNEQHPDMNLRDMFPIERTFSEWSQSTYAATGVYAPQFAGNKPDGIVSTCEDCHMRDVSGRGSNVSGSPLRSDLGLHDLTGGNNFVPDILASFYPTEVNTTELQAAKQRVIHMLQLAATLQLTPQGYGVDVRVTNETGHKMPSGYPEGRRIWINVRARNATGSVIYESGAYDQGTGVLTHDSKLKIYETHPGLSPALAAALGFPEGPSFHFVLNDTVWFDNRIPPRGFTNAAFASVQSPPVGYAYPDGQYWDDTSYALPLATDSVTVNLYYQSISKEYVEFLRDTNHTNNAGQDLYNAWAANGMSTPVLMASSTVKVNVTQTGVADGPIVTFPFALSPGVPNPFASRTSIAYSVPDAGRVTLAVFDVNGRLVRTLLDERQLPGEREVAWDGKDERGVRLAAGIYFVHLRAGGDHTSRRIVLLP